MIISEKVVCYYGTWSVWRNGLGRFEVTDIDPTICTHIIYTFFGVTAGGGVEHLDPYLDLVDNYGKGINLFLTLNPKNHLHLHHGLMIDYRLHPKIHWVKVPKPECKIISRFWWMESWK